MGSKTGIAWTDSTWHPLAGCSHASRGCDHCWAEKVASRLAANPVVGKRYAGTVTLEGRWTGLVRLIPEALAVPLHWRRPRRVAVALGGDLFHGGLSDTDRAAVFGVMAEAARHTFQVLTKRPMEARRWFRAVERATAGPHDPDPAFVIRTAATNLCVEGVDQGAGNPWPLPNVWLGTSAEDQPTLESRVPELLACPAALRWLSLEPLLGPVDMDPPTCPTCGGHDAVHGDSFADGTLFCREHGDEMVFGAWLDPLNGGVGWVVVGCESGTQRRPSAIEWVRSVVVQCREAGVPCFVKQVSLDGRVSHDPAEWPEDLRVREMPEALERVRAGWRAAKGVDRG